MSRAGRVWAVIAGGGTGGHVVPAIAIGKALAARGHASSSIHFVGSRRGIEATMVPAAGFSVTLLPGRGISRRVSWDNVGAIGGLLSALVRAVVLVRRLRPSVVVTVGGYASAATALAAAMWRVPLVVAEQNAVPGWANRIAGRFASVCAVSFQGTPLPRPVLTGNPVRAEVVAAATGPRARAEARLALGLPEEAFVVAVAGGSLGARHLNDTVLDMVRHWSPPRPVHLRHVVGRRDFPEMSRARPGSLDGRLRYEQVEFEHRMDLLLAASDVAVQRAGASTVAELAVVGIPSILVPLPGAPGDHQTQNARRLADSGAATLIRDGDLDAQVLRRELESLMEDDDRRAGMAAAALALGRPDAADRVALLAEEHARD